MINSTFVSICILFLIYVIISVKKWNLPREEKLLHVFLFLAFIDICFIIASLGLR